MGRFAEGDGELATEVRRRHVGRGSHVRHGQCLKVPGIDEVFGPEEVAGHSLGQDSVAIRSRFSTDFSSMATGTTGHVNPERISSEALDQSQ